MNKKGMEMKTLIYLMLGGALLLFFILFYYYKDMDVNMLLNFMGDLF